MIRAAQFFVALIAFTFSIASAQAAPTLKWGDPAPPLVGSKWIKGEPVKSFEPGKIYVIEFWATWCGPCREAIPHITEMQAKYKDVTFIGQDVWENDQAAAEPFVKKMGDAMNYRVVLDDVSAGGSGANGEMGQAWLAAAGQDGIPCSFIIDRAGKIAWIGHPMNLEQILQQVLAGTYDTQKELARDAVEKDLQQRYSQALEKKDNDAALTVLEEYRMFAPHLSLQIDAMRFELLLRKNQYDQAYKLANEIADAPQVSPQILCEVASTIVDEKGIEKRDLNLAEKMAARANELVQAKDAAIADVYAHVLFEKGDVSKAIEIQTQAVELAFDPQMRRQMQTTLDQYKKAAK